VAQGHRRDPLREPRETQRPARCAIYPQLAVISIESFGRIPALVGFAKTVGEHDQRHRKGDGRISVFNDVRHALDVLEARLH